MTYVNKGVKLVARRTCGRATDPVVVERTGVAS